MITYGGCGYRSPGIGDIAYVKDLLVEKVVSTTFQCSVFGVPKSDTIYQSGWVSLMFNIQAVTTKNII
jgi:hypothetical protein